MRSCLAVLLALAALLTACSGGSKNNSDSNSPEASTTTVATVALPAITVSAVAAAATTTAAPAGAAATRTSTPAAAGTAAAVAVGKTVRAGDLDLTVVAVRPVNSRTFDRTNTDDIAVDLIVVNSRGTSTAGFSPELDVKLIDAANAPHEVDPFCSNCPDAMQSATLDKGARAQGTVYFDLGGATTKQFEYQRFSSDPKQVVDLPAVQGTAGSAARSGPTADPNSSDCQYSTKLATASLSFLGSIFGLLDLSLSATPGPSGTPALTPDQATKALTSLLQGARQTSTALKQITPPADFKAYHADAIKVFDALTQQLVDAQKAATSGDTSKLDPLLNGNSALDDLSNKLDATYPDLAARLSACPSPLDGAPSKP